MRTLGNIIYKPFGLIIGLTAGLLSTRIFNWIWGKFDEEDPPKPSTEWASWGKLLSAAAVQGVIYKVVRVIVDRGTAKSFSYLTGQWPGERVADRRA